MKTVLAKRGGAYSFGRDPPQQPHVSVLCYGTERTSPDIDIKRKQLPKVLLLLYFRLVELKILQFKNIFTSCCLFLPKDVTVGYYPEPDASSPHSPTRCIKNPFNIFLVYTTLSSKLSSSFRFSNQNLYPFLMSQEFYMLRQSHFLLFYRSEIFGRQYKL